MRQVWEEPPNWLVLRVYGRILEHIARHSLWERAGGPAHWPRAGAPPSELDAELRQQLAPLTREWNAAHERERVLVDQVRAAWTGLEAVVVIPLLPDGAVRIESLDRIGSYL